MPDYLPKDTDLSAPLPVGVTTYEGFFTEDELAAMERSVELTEEISLKGGYLPMTA